MAERWVRLLLRLYPRRFQERFGEEMLVAYRDHARARGRGAAPSSTLVLILRTTCGMLAGAWGEWRERAGGPERGGRGRPPVRPPSNPWATLADDLRHAVRSLIRAPGLVLLSVSVLGAGLALVVIFFSFLHAAFLRPLPYPEAERLVAVAGGSELLLGASREALYLAREARSFEGVIAWQRTGATVVGAGSGEATEHSAGRVEPGFFDLLGGTPRLGRAFTAAEAAADAPVVVIGHGLWTSMGGDPDVLGRVVRLSDVPHTVIGVTPPGFSFGHGQVLWRPLDPGSMSAETTFEILARLREGVTHDKASGELLALSARLPGAPGAGSSSALRLNPDPLDRTSGLGPLPWILLGMAGMVLLVICSNVGGLLLARAARRRSEVAVRAALGASRGRIVRQSLIEGAGIAMVAGALAVLLSVWLTPLIPALLGGNLPFWLQPRVDAAVVTFAAVASLATVVAFALLPALEGARVDLLAALGAGSSGTTPSRRQRRLQRLGVTAQVGLSFVLVLAFGLVYESARRMSTVLWEIDVDRVVEGWVRLSSARYGEPERADAYWTTAAERLEALPEVEGVAVYGVPRAPKGGAGPTDSSVFGPPHRGTERIPVPDGVRSVAVDPSYFAVLGLPIVEGRGLSDSDSDPLEVVVSRALAELAWPGEEAVGRTLRLGREGPEVGVVGVSEDPLTFRGDREGIRLARSAHVYLPRRRVTTTNDRVLVRTRGSAEEALATVSGALREVDPTQPVIAVETLRSIREEPMVLQTFLMRIFGPFAVCALAVALIGLYGLVGYEVALRRREMGVRAALGARGGTLLRLVLSDVLVLSAVGVVAGAALAGAAGELIGAFILFESPALSLAVYFGAASLVLATAALASAVPARLAAKADPVEALRGP